MNTLSIKYFLKYYGFMSASIEYLISITMNGALKYKQLLMLKLNSYKVMLVYTEFI